MNKSSIIEKVTYKPHLKDYSYAVMFLLLASFFAFAVIKPVLTIAFSLKREAQDLAKVNAAYEGNILRLVEIQSKMEKIRDRMYILDDALPKSPQIRKLITAVNQAALAQGLGVKSISVSPVDLKSTKTDSKPLTVNIDVSGDFPQVQSFFSSLLTQRRVKTIESVKITRVAESSESGQYLRIQMVIHAYYL